MEHRKNKRGHRELNPFLKKSYKNYCDTAIRVINGYYGNGDERENKLEKEGYSYKKVQAIVDILLK